MMVLCGITLVHLEKELRDADTTLLSPFYADGAVFYGSATRSVVQLRLMMDQGPDRGYFPEPEKSLFIADNPKYEETERHKF